jgi:hypothetical protein
MFGAKAVKHMAIAENIKPERKANNGIRKIKGLETNPNTATTPKTMLELIRLRVAPHNISPAITSSMLTGVVIIASNVF